MWIQRSWLLKKPADLDPLCFRVYPVICIMARVISCWQIFCNSRLNGSYFWNLQSSHQDEVILQMNFINGIFLSKVLDIQARVALFFLIIMGHIDCILSVFVCLPDYLCLSFSVCLVLYVCLLSISLYVYGLSVYESCVCRSVYCLCVCIFSSHFLPD